MIDLLKAELAKIQAEKTQIMASPIIAQLNALTGAEKVLEKMIILTEEDKTDA